jgi:hypothetical protein
VRVGEIVWWVRGEGGVGGGGFEGVKVSLVLEQLKV